MAYHSSLLNAYEGEIIGHTFFLALGDAHYGAVEIQKLHLLAGLETRTAAILAPLIERHNLSPRPVEVLALQGMRDAAVYAGLSWREMNARFVADFPPFVDEFLATEAMAPEADLAVLKLVTAHEVALIAFAQEEAAGTGLGVAHLQGYLAQLDVWQASA